MLRTTTIAPSPASCTRRSLNISIAGMRPSPLLLDALRNVASDRGLSFKSGRIIIVEDES